MSYQWQVQIRVEQNRQNGNWYAVTGGGLDILFMGPEVHGQPPQMGHHLPVRCEAYGPTPEEAMARLLTLMAITWRQAHQISHPMHPKIGCEVPPQLDPSSPDAKTVTAGCYLCGGQHEKSFCPNVPK